MSSPNASDETIRTAARQACALDFVHELPEGFDTVIGEFGSRLSAGQRRRLALACVLVREPAVLLLDEPTTDLDRAAEKALTVELKSLAAERTVLVVTHSPVLIKAVDGVIVLNAAGRIQAAGAAGEVLPSLDGDSNG